MLKFAFIVFLLVLFPMIGVAVFVSSLGMLRSADEMRSWPTVQGEVISSEVATEFASTLGERRREPIEVYSAQVSYEYVVEGKSYQGNRIGVQNSASTDRYQAELTVDEFPAGDVTVYYNPDNPAEALLAPQNSGGIVPGLVIGSLLMVVPSCLIVLGLRTGHVTLPELPLHIRMWWDLKFGKYKGHGTSDVGELRSEQVAIESRAASVDEAAPPREGFVEHVVSWKPGIRIELASNPSSIALHLLLAAVAGVVVAWMGMFPVTQVVFRRDTPHGPELWSTFATILVAVSSLTFFISRFSERRSKIVVDWSSGLITAHRDFSASRQFSIRDVRRVIVQCQAVGNRPRKYRALIELDAAYARMVAARTSQPRRKLKSAKDIALRLAKPLAAALNVPVEFEGTEP